MEYVNLGKSDLKVSRICMGCMGFGNAATGQHSWTVDEEISKSIIKRGLELGINFYDTAIAYQAGTSEEYLGKAIREYAKRDEVVIATKFLPRSQEEIANGISGKEHVHSSLDASLSHLGMDYVDLYIYHMWDWNTPVEDYLAGMAEGVKVGKIRQIGIANCFAWQLAEANAIAKENGWPEFVSVQNHYNLIMREEEREMNVYAAERNIALTPYSALAAGRLSKRPGEISKRLEQDAYAKLKYDATSDKDASSVEMNDKTFRPEIVKEDLNLSSYDTILLGFPIWWYVAPTIINTFLENYDFSGKRIVLFATSGGSGFGNTIKELKPSAADAEIVEGKILNRASDDQLKEWIAGL